MIGISATARRVGSGLLAVLPLLGAPAALAQTTVEDVLSAGNWYIKAVPVPSSAEQGDANCWSTDLSGDPFHRGWPVVVEFRAGDILAYATGPIRVTSDDPGPHPVSMFIEHFAEVRGEYRHLRRANLLAEFEVYNEPEAEFTDWFLAVYLVVPRIVSRLPEPRSVDWFGEVSGFVNYSCSGQIRLVPGAPPPPPAR